MDSARMEKFVSGGQAGDRQPAEPFPPESEKGLSRRAGNGGSGPVMAERSLDIQIASQKRLMEGIERAYELIKLVSETMPMAVSLWTENIELFECNEEAVRLFRLRDKDEYVKRFYELSPKYQPDGRLSAEGIREIVRKAFTGGGHTVKWTHQMPDGSPIPSEVTLVRAHYGDGNIVVAYTRDLREYTSMMLDIERRDALLNAANQTASTLLRADYDDFGAKLHRCMGIIADAVDVDRVWILKNRAENGKLYCSPLYEWPENSGLIHTYGASASISCDEMLSGWEQTAYPGYCISNLVRNMSDDEKKLFSPLGILSVLVTPVFMHGAFWGFVAFCDCRKERMFTENENSILRSISLQFTSALMQNETLMQAQTSAANLKAVVECYPGIIYSVDTDRTLLSINGLSLGKLGNLFPFLEGKKITMPLADDKLIDIPGIVDKTFAEGSQEWVTEKAGKVFRLRTSFAIDSNDKPIAVIGSVDDITNKTRLLSRLKTALKEAEAASSAKSDFLASISHEMRTPLNAVIGLSELMLEDSSLNEETVTNLEKVYGAGSTLLSIVNDILDISKVEAGKFEINRGEYEVSNIINDAVTQNILRIESKRINFVLNMDANTPARLYGDELRVKQIVNNLLSNASKYTDEGTVELFVHCENTGVKPAPGDTVWMTMRVSDTGIGIRSEDIGSLFTDYMQFDLKPNRKIGGTGLGLAITKRLAELMGGTISVKSDFGKGSAFTVRIRQQYVNGAVIGPEMLASLKTFRYSANKLRHNSKLHRIQLPYARVLVVDDNVTNLDVARGLMGSYAMRIDCVTGGQEAIDVIRDGTVRYNAVFMDHMMPGMDGIEATRIIRKEIGTEYARTVPIIALTANAVMGNEKIFLDNGFQAFLSKPIDLARLDEVIREWVRDKERKDADAKTPMLKEQRGGERRLSEDRRSGGKRWPEEERRHGERRSGKDRRALAREEKTPLLQFTGAVAGLDMAKGLARFRDENSFLRILRSYALSTRSTIRSMQEVGKESLPGYAITVHGLKGASLGIGAEELGRMAEALEHAAKDGDLAFVTEHNESFLQTALRLVSQIDDMLATISPDLPKPKKRKPDQEALGRLLEACKSYDMDAAEEIARELDAYTYESDGELVLSLVQNMNDFKLNEIVNILSAAGTSAR